MTQISNTIARLAKMRAMAPAWPVGSSTGRLKQLAAFGSNPGALTAKTYVPEDLPSRAALVVVLHGCTQTAEGYDAGSGWSQLADRHGFALLFPEQQRQNNPNLCFNWFSPADNRRDRGEALSIRQMIDTVAASRDIDADRIYITGLSAGGAMASIMLASYPEIFAGGAIIAGLPYGCAASVPEAFDRMRGHNMPDDARLAAMIREASAHGGPWPTISVWQGSGDATVNPSNADAIVSQWSALHGVSASPSRTEAVDGYPRRVWHNGEGREVIEHYSITGMAHGTPLDTSGEEGCGASSAFMLDVGISSTRHICRFWGLTEGREHKEGTALKAGTAAVKPARLRQVAAPPAAGAHVPDGVAEVIEKALRAAGLMGRNS